MHIAGMTPSPSSGAALSGAAVAAAPGDDSIRARAHAVLADKDLTVDDLRGRLPVDNGTWYRKVAAALVGEGRFTSLTLALFAEAVGIDVLWLITGEQPLIVTVHACVVDETVGARTAAVTR